MELDPSLIPFRLLLGATVGGVRSVEAFFLRHKKESFNWPKFLKTVGNGAWQGALIGLVIQDPVELFTAVFLGNVVAHDAWKRIKGKKK